MDFAPGTISHEHTVCRLYVDSRPPRSRCFQNSYFCNYMLAKPDKSPLLLCLTESLDYLLQCHCIGARDPLNAAVTPNLNTAPTRQPVDRNPGWLAPSEHNKCRHRAHLIALRDVPDMIDVHFGKGQLPLNPILISELREERCDRPAWRTPVSIEVDDDVLGRLEHGVQLGTGCGFDDLVGCLGDRGTVLEECLV